MLAGYWKETAEDLADDDPIPLACGQDVIFMVPDAELGREAGRAEVQPRDATSRCGSVSDPEGAAGVLWEGAVAGRVRGRVGL